MRSVFEASTTINTRNGEAAQAAAAANTAVKTYIDRLRGFKPTGRLIVPDRRDSGMQGQLLENGDRIKIPPKPNSVAVFGAVYGEGSYLAVRTAPLSEVLAAAGGARPGADTSEIFILKADGRVQAATTGWFSRPTQFDVEPGDTVFVPTDTQRGRAWVVLRDIGTLLYQFGLGAAALKVLN